MKIYVGNFPFTTTEKELLKTFEAFGKVESAEIVKDVLSGHSKFAYVDMPYADEACSAIKELNGKKFNGSSLLVNEALKW